MAHDATKLMFFVGGAYEAVRIIDMGGTSIDAAIADELNIDAHMASAYKSGDPNADVLHTERVTAVYDSIAGEIGRALNFFNFNNPETPIEAVYCGGGCARFEPLMAVVSEQVAVPLESVGSLIASENVPDDVLMRCASAVGATMV